MQKQYKYRVCVTVQAAKPYQHYTEHYTLTAALRHIRALVQSGETSPKGEIGPIVLVNIGSAGSTELYEIGSHYGSM
jgi:hypothetical protein